nr:hypothetical protein [Scopulibacillus daqui]
MVRNAVEKVVYPNASINKDKQIIKVFHARENKRYEKLEILIPIKNKILDGIFLEI